MSYGVPSRSPYWAAFLPSSTQPRRWCHGGGCAMPRPLTPRTSILNMFFFLLLLLIIFSPSTYFPSKTKFPPAHPSIILSHYLSSRTHISSLTSSHYRHNPSHPTCHPNRSYRIYKYSMTTQVNPPSSTHQTSLSSLSSLKSSA
jgi:hypothetical protein